MTTRMYLRSQSSLVDFAPVGRCFIYGHGSVEIHSLHATDAIDLEVGRLSMLVGCRFDGPSMVMLHGGAVAIGCDFGPDTIVIEGDGVGYISPYFAPGSQQWMWSDLDAPDRRGYAPRVNAALQVIEEGAA